MSANLRKHFPAEVREQRAAEQRQRIHNSVGELKSSVRDAVRERLDVQSYARSHIWPLLTVTSLLALVSGYGTAAMFSRR